MQSLYPSWPFPAPPSQPPAAGPSTGGAASSGSPTTSPNDVQRGQAALSAALADHHHHHQQQQAQQQQDVRPQSSSGSRQTSGDHGGPGHTGHQGTTRDRKGKGGRPRDFVWAFFSGDNERAECRTCGFVTDRPKAFRMRQHILVCPGVSDEDRQRVKDAIEAREAATAAKKSTPTEASAAHTRRGSEEEHGEANATVELQQQQQQQSANRPNYPPPPQPPPLPPPPPPHPPQPQRMPTSYDDFTTLQSPFEGLSNPKRRRTTMPVPGTTAAAPPKTHENLRSPITCHVLDSNSGRPAQRMNCRLDKLTPNGFILLSSSATNADGRCQDLMTPAPRVDLGIYKITFFTQEYFAARSLSSFFPFVEITFEIKEEETHYHVPLLLSPYSYTTYRGS